MFVVTTHEVWCRCIYVMYNDDDGNIYVLNMNISGAGEMCVSGKPELVG